jgi:hypothetical protein
VTSIAKTDWTGLAATPFRPKRRRLAEAKSALAPWFARAKGEQDAGAIEELVREAWESCASAGLVPLEWLSSDRRWLHIDRALAPPSPDGTLSLKDRRALRVLDHPPSLEACLAMASDAEGVLAAEELCRFVRDALSAWLPLGFVQNPVLWRVDSQPPESGAGLMDVYSAYRQPLEYQTLGLAGERAFAAALGSRAPSGWPLFIARLARNSAYFDRIVTSDSTAINIDGRDAPMREAPSPFARAAELFAMGYGVERSVHHQQIRLLAAPVAL